MAMNVERFSFHMDLLDKLLPEGILRNSMIGIFGETGTGKSVLLNEIAYRALQEGETVSFILLEDTPLSRISNMKHLGFDVIPYLERDKLRFLDCFSFRLAERRFEFPKQLLELKERIKGSVVEIENPRDIDEIWSHLEREGRMMRGKGLILMDSLTECLTISTDPDSLLDLLKASKAVVCKYYLVPLIYTFHFGFFDEFRYTLEVASDGVIDLRFDPDTIKMYLIKQMRVRRMSGSYHYPGWITFEVEREKGLVTLEVKSKDEKLAKGSKGNSER